MKIIKDYKIPYNNDFGHKKTYSKDGLLLTDIQYCSGIGYHCEKKYTYNIDNKISEEIIKVSDVFSGDEEINERKYTYKNNNIRVYEIRNKKRNTNNNYEHEYNYDLKNWENIDEIKLIEEHKYENNNLVNFKSFDLINNLNYEIKYDYDLNNNITFEAKYIDNILVYEKHKIFNEFNKLENEKEYRYYKNEKYLAIEIKNYYDINGFLENIETYGLYNAKMYLYKKLSFKKFNNKIIEVLERLPCGHDEYFGFYNFENLKFHIEQQNNSDSVNIFKYNSKKLNPTFFDNLLLVKESKNLKIFQNETLIEELHYNFSDENYYNEEILIDRNIYINENFENKIKTIICLNIFEDFHEKVYKQTIEYL